MSTPEDRFSSGRPAEYGFASDRLDAALQFARENESAQVLVLCQGAVIAAGCWDCSWEDAGDVFAVQKGLTAILVGMAIERDLVALDDPISQHLGAGWSALPAAHERAVTIRHVMAMTTGMSDQLAPEGKLGETWRYNNPAYNYLKLVLQKRAGFALNQLTQQWLGAPLGFTGTRWIERDALLPNGRAITGLAMTALDMAALGELVRNDGRWHGQRLLREPQYLRDCVAPGSAMNPAWGLLWWNNHHEQYMVPFREEIFPGRYVPEAPPDLIATRGAQDQFVSIVPMLELTIVRRGAAAGMRGAFERELIKRVLQAR